MKPIPIKTRKDKVGHCKKSIAPASSETALLEHVQRDALPFEYIAEAFIKGKVLEDWDRNAWTPTEISVPCIANKRSSVFAFQQDAKILACHCEHISW